MIGTKSRFNERASTIEFTRIPSNQKKNAEVRESVIYRIHQSRESARLIFQIGTASPDTAVQAASIVAPYVAGIDVNSGCPKPFSTSGGMGAALLSTPDLLCSILRALVKEVGEKHEIGISVKIRLLKTPEETRSLVERLCQTGITGLTIHCRTRQMRKTEKAIREQLRMIGDICRDAGVACLMNGDVENREQAEELVKEYNVDGAMIATAAEKNPSIFRAASDGGPAAWEEVVEGYMKEAIAVENRWGNTKFLLAQMIPGKQQGSLGLGPSKTYEDICRRLGLTALIEPAAELDQRLGMSDKESRASKKSKNRTRDEHHTEEAKEDTARKKPKLAADVQPSAHLQPSDFLTDLHADIVAPTVKV